MKTLIPAFIFLLTASPALAQSAPEETAANASSQQLVVEALNNAPRYSTFTTSPAPRYVVQQPAATVSQSGIGPSSNMHPADYGFTSMNDLRQLNF